MTNEYDGLLRRTNVAVYNGATLLAASGYGFDALSRLDAVSTGARTAAYAYLSNSPLVRALTFTDSAAVRLAVTNTHDSLNRLTRKSSVPSASFAGNLSFDYAYNSANQRIAVTNADASRWDYAYDALGQLTNGLRRWSDSSPVPGQQFAYGFDDIGNRKWTLTGGDNAGSSRRLALYTNNLLNQITGREVPGYVEVQGSASDAATVTVNLQPTYRRDEFYRAELSVANSGALVWQSVTNIAVLQTPGGDMLTTNKGSVLVPKTPQVMQYDLDGNLTNDGVWSYAWDATDRPRANRLKNMSGLSTLPTAARQALTFRYDYAGRRILKVVSNWTGSAWAGAYTNKFLYDGWNLLAEVNHSNAVLRSYTWGTDASGTMQGAGGVGGLLAMTVHLGTNAGTYFYAYDGNHNVVGLVNATTGEWAAKYEYGPFHELLRASGPLALENPFLAATKYYDWETGLYYYGHRFYDPSTGRWLSRDPIAEDGGVNLYGMLANELITRIDLLGREPAPQLAPPTWTPRVIQGGASGAAAAANWVPKVIQGGAAASATATSVAGSGGITVGLGSTATVGVGTTTAGGVIAFGAGYYAGYKIDQATGLSDWLGPKIGNWISPVATLWWPLPAEDLATWAGLEVVVIRDRCGRGRCSCVVRCQNHVSGDVIGWIWGFAAAMDCNTAAALAEKQARNGAPQGTSTRHCKARCTPL